MNALNVVFIENILNHLKLIYKKDKSLLSSDIKYEYKKLKCLLKNYLNDPKMNNLLLLLKILYTVYLKFNKNNKICFLLLSSINEDLQIYNNLQYLGYDFPLFFDYNLQKVEELYNEGYRIFIGLSSTEYLTSLLPFFVNHPDTYGISLTSTGPSLNNRQITNVFRLTPPDNLIIGTYLQFFENGNYQHIHLLQQQGDIFSETLSQLLFDALQPWIGTKIISVDIISLTLDNIDEVLSIVDVDPSHVSVLSIVNNVLINTFNEKLSASLKLGNYIESASPTPKNLNSNIVDIYYFIGYEPAFERNVQAQINALGITNTSPNLIDAINMALSFSINNNYDNVIGSFGYLYFNEVGDKTKIFYTLRRFDGSTWVPYIGYQDHPSLGFSIVRPIIL